MLISAGGSGSARGRRRRWQRRAAVDQRAVGQRSDVVGERSGGQPRRHRGHGAASELRCVRRARLRHRSQVQRARRQNCEMGHRDSTSIAATPTHRLLGAPPLPAAVSGRGPRRRLRRYRYDCEPAPIATDNGGAAARSEVIAKGSREIPTRSHGEEEGGGKGEGRDPAGQGRRSTRGGHCVPHRRRHLLPALGAIHPIRPPAS